MNNLCVIAQAIWPGIIYSLLSETFPSRARYMNAIARFYINCMKRLSPSYLLQTITLCSTRILFVDPEYFVVKTDAT